MSTPKEPHEDGTAAAPSSSTTSPASTGSSPEAATRSVAVEQGGSDAPADADPKATPAKGSSSPAPATGSKTGTEGGTPPPWQRASSAAPGPGGPGGAPPRSGPFPSPVGRPGGAPVGGGARPGPESGPMPASRPGPESGPMPAARAGQVPGGGARPDAGERPAAAAASPGSKPGASSSTALIDAPTNQLSPDQLGMRSQERGGDRSSDALDDDASPRASRGSKAPRRASLQIRRFDPWSVLKLALVLGVALFFVWMFAVGVLYAVLDGMGVWAQLNGTYQDLTSDTGGGGGDLITAAGVFGVAAVIGVVNTILFTALASVSAFIYNISADVAGGIEVTLSERD